MPDTGLTLKVKFEDKDGFLPMLKRAATANTSRLMRLVGLRMRKMQVDHFIQQKDSKGKTWTSLKESTIKARRKGRKVGRAGKILQDTGRLKNSIVMSSTADRAQVGTNVVYAATQQFGRETIPAREFIYLTDKEGNELVDMIGKEIFKWMKKK